jgi:hypothetical protein
MFVKPGLAPHAGKSYVRELIHFAGTPAEMTALATGELGCAARAYSTRSSHAAATLSTGQRSGREEP